MFLFGRIPIFWVFETEEVRFELTKRFHVYTLSKRAPSATRTLLQESNDRKKVVESIEFSIIPQLKKRRNENPLPVS
jgi:hypothetical protein